ncbi:hypothetical protein Scep_025321 [Stephania cephalantha]|uniref:Uncharacterized protein n=1 Tax=Stephania cephalantha TaxID=152367 RepID=A0AAP0HR46_9MAGN
MLSRTLTLTLSSPSPPPSILQSSSPSSSFLIRSLHHRHNRNPLDLLRRRWRRRRGSLGCRAELAQDAPFAAAIGACVLNSLIFPVAGGGGDEDGDSVMDSTDARFAVMGIISFIPYFNWLSWVFAWLDTGRRRYAVYAIVYLAPYLSAKNVEMTKFLLNALYGDIKRLPNSNLVECKMTNLSLSPEESWLPIASIIFCIAHIQLEASIRNGDIQGFQLFNDVSRFFPSSRKKDHSFEDHADNKMKGKKKEHGRLPSAQEQSRNELRGSHILEKQSDEHFSDDGDVTGKSKDEKH